MKVEYKVNELIDKKWVENCISPGWQRDLYPSNINKFLNDIKNGDLVICLTTKNRLASVGFAEMDSKQMIKEKHGMAVRTDVVML